MKTLYLSDLDGTLLRSDERISEYTASTINRFVREGGCFSYATARSAITASKVTAGLTTEFPIISYNGSFIVSNKSKEILLSNFFTKEESNSIRRVLSEHDIVPIVYAMINGVEHFSFIDRNVSDGMRLFLDSRQDDVRRREIKSMNALYLGEIFYFTCIGSANELAPIHDKFKSNHYVNCIYQEDIYSHAQWCEILPKKSTKANAALQLRAMLGCDRMVVFGDGMNDLSLFSIADESYAMANAVPELKEIATAVIDSNNNDGVAKWLSERMV